MGQRNPYTPQEIEHPTSGPKRSIGQLLALVDADDPAFLCIVDVLRDMQSASVELTTETVALAVALGRQKRARSRALAKPQTPQPAPPGSIVYYIRRAEAIKIGTTTEPHTRFGTLMPDEILAFEPGGVTEESRRHAQFAHLRLGRAGEYFRMAPELHEHIAEIRQSHGDPDPSWPSIERKRTRVDIRDAGLPLPVNPETVTIAEGARKLGLPAGTVYGWARRGCMPLAGLDGQNRKLYHLDHMATLWDLNRPRRRHGAP